MSVATVYADTSAILRALLETGTSPDLEARLSAAEATVVSRLALVEASRAVLRLRLDGVLPLDRLADGERQIADFFAGCEIVELSPAICEAAQRVAPDRLLRTLDALHLATYLDVRRRIPEVELLTADERLRAAAGAAPP